MLRDFTEGERLVIDRIVAALPPLVPTLLAHDTAAVLAGLDRH